jgi:hypothetical protein
MIQKDIDKIYDEYFNWLYHLVCNDKYYNKVSYKKLLHFLDSVDYIPNLPMDDNRRIDGLDFRYTFGYDYGYSEKEIDEIFRQKNCSMLEMMIALSYKVEVSITSDLTFGNRTGQWFWGMVVNLGLGKMTDDNFDLEYCLDSIDIFMRNKYSPNGHGGLFTVNNPPENMQNVDIWCQFMWYLNQNIYEENDIL